MPFHLPNNTEHLSIIGQNGSGKTQLAAWVLSQANFSEYDETGVKYSGDDLWYYDDKGRQVTVAQPWIIIDYKLDPLLNNNKLKKHIKELSVTGAIPSSPGLYIVHPRPDQESEIEDFLWRVWERGKTGLYFDEAHIVPKQEKGAFQALLTQGRSKKIPMIILTQKPSWVSRFVFSEAKYFSVFYVQDRRDRVTLSQFLPIDMEEPLPRFHSHWYDTATREHYRLRPVPGAGTILGTLKARLPRRWL